MTAATCDTSILVPGLVAWHSAHEESRSLLRTEIARVPAHALLECYSVLTRLPAPHRISADDAAAAIAALELTPVTLPAERHGDVVATLASERIRGGAVYDGLIAATALHHGLRLITRDRRARPTYDAVGVSYTLL